MKLGMEVGLGLRQIVLNGNPAPLPQRSTVHKFSTHVCCGQMAGWIKLPLGRKAGLSPGHIVLDGYPPPLPKGAQSPNFWLMSIVAKRSLISATAEHLFYFILGIVPSPHWWTDLDIQSATTENRRGKRKKKKKERNHSCKI